MRRTVVVVGAFIVASCGAGGAGPGTAAPSATTVDRPVDTARGGEAPPVETLPTVRQVSEATIAQLGGDEIATAATLLAVDAGYELGQVVDAGPAGRLRVNGQIVTADGSPAAPAGEPTGLIVDDLTAEYQVAGFGQVPERPLSAVMVRFGEAAEPPGKEIVYQRLFLLMALMQQGYTLEQIMTALFTFGGVSNELELTEADGTVVPPADAPYDSLELADEDYDRAFATTSTSTAPPTTRQPGTEDEQRRDELVGRAVGVYAVTPDLGAHLRGLGDVIGVTEPEGEFVVAGDGTISGSFVYTIVQGDEDYRLTTLWDRTLVEASLTVLDDGLTFAASMDLVITWDGSDTQVYAEQVTGILDVDIGQLEVTGFTEVDSVRFAR